MTIEVDLPNGRTIYTPNKEMAEWPLGHIHYTLNDIEWREVESHPDSDGPRLMSPATTVNDGNVLIQNGRTLIFESVRHLTHYVRSFVDSYEDRFGDATHMVEELSSPHVDMNSLVSA